MKNSTLTLIEDLRGAVESYQTELGGLRVIVAQQAAEISALRLSTRYSVRIHVSRDDASGDNTIHIAMNIPDKPKSYLMIEHHVYRDNAEVTDDSMESYIQIILNDVIRKANVPDGDVYHLTQEVYGCLNSHAGEIKAMIAQNKK